MKLFMRARFLAYAFLLLFVTFYSAAQTTVSIDGICYLIDKSQGTATVTRSDGSTGLSASSAYMQSEIIVPSSIIYEGEKYQVTAIHDIAFYGAQCKNIYLPSTIRGIENVPKGGWPAFINNKNLQTIVLPDQFLIDKNTSIFSGCTSLSSVILSYKETGIPAEAFRNTALKVYGLPSSVTSIGDFAFENVDLSEGLFLNSSVRSLGGSFVTGTKFSELYLPPSLNLSMTGDLLYSNSTIFDRGGFKTLVLSAELPRVTAGNAYQPYFGMDNLEKVICAYSVQSPPSRPAYFQVKKTNVSIWGNSSAVTESYYYTLIDNATGSNYLRAQITENILGMLPAMYFGQGGFDLNEKPYIGLADPTGIVYTSSDSSIASINGSKVTFHKAGVVTITASRGNDVFANPTRRLYIMPNTVTVKINPQSNSIYEYSCAWANENNKNWSSDYIRSLITTPPSLKSIIIGNNQENGSVAYGAQSDCFVFIYDSSDSEYQEPGPGEKNTLTFTNLTETVYGNDPIDLLDYDKDIIDQTEGVSFSYSVVSSQPNGIVNIENNSLTILGAGEATILVTPTGGENNYIFENTERTLTIGKRNAAISVLSDKIEDDATEVPTPKFEFVTTENSGVLEADKEAVADIITLQWDTESVTEGVFGLKSTQLPEHADYNLSLQQPEGGASLTIVRAVNRKIMSVSQSESTGSMSVTVSKECRLKIGDKIYELKAGVNSFELSGLPTQFDVFTDYPEYVTAVDLSKTSVSSVVFDDSLTNLDEVDITDTGMKETDVTLPGDFDGQLKGAYVEPKVSVTLDDLPEKVYGDEPFSLKDLDIEQLGDIEGIVVKYEIKSSEPENIVSVDENGRLTINGAGGAVITTTISGYDDSRYEFANTERTLTIGKRDAAISVLSDKIEDDVTEVPSPKYEFVLTENSGVLDTDKEAVADIITLQWDTESVTEGVFGLKSTQLPEHADYNLSLQQPEGGASLTIVRAVNRKIMSVSQSESNGSMSVTVSKECRLKIGDKIYELSPGANTIYLTSLPSTFDVFTDYPEYVTAVDLSKTSVSSVVFDDSLTNLDEVDITDTGMKEADVTLPGDFDGELKGAYVEPKVTVTLDDLPEKVYGDEPFSIKEFDADKLDDITGISISYSVKSSEPDEIISIDSDGIVEINGAGEVVITATISGYDDNRYEFVNTERSLTIGKRDAAISVLSDKIEDDVTEVPSPKYEFVLTENSGVLDADKEAVADIITLQWDTESVTEGVFGLKSTQLPEHTDYNLSLQQPEGGASLTIVRAVNRKIMSVSQSESTGSMSVTVSKECRLKIGDKIYELKAGVNSFELSGLPTQFDVFTDYPEYVTAVDLSKTSVSSVVFDDSLTNLDEVDITDTGMKETDVTLPGDFDGQLKGAYVEPKVTKTLDDLPEKVYGDEPFSLKDLDADKLDDITGISISYSVKSSEPENIVSVDENGRLTISGAGGAVITTTISGYDDNRYEFVNTERSLTIGKRDAAISVLSDKIEDDVTEVPTPKFEFVTTENTGVLEVDRQEIESLITLQWDTESVTEGVFGLKSTQLPEHADYNLSLQQPEGGASLTIVRAVNRKIMSVSQSESTGSMSVTVSKECRLKIGDKIYELSPGANTIYLTSLPSTFDVFTDYPEYVTAVDLSKTSVSSVVFDDSLTNLDEVDITDTGMKETDVTLPGDFDGQLKGAYVEPKVSVTLDDLPEKVYGDEPFSIKDLDVDKLDDITGISISYSVKSSEPDEIISIDSDGIVKINGAGEVVITATISSYDDNRYEFANTERSLTIGKRDAAISVLSDKIEDDASEVPSPKYEFVLTENSGVLDTDKEAVADIITLQWDTESVTEGVFGLKSTQLPEHADYNLSLQQPEGGASLTIIRAVNRKIMSVSQSESTGSMSVTVSKECRLKIGDKIYELKAGVNSFELSDLPTQFDVFTDYPEYVTAVDLSKTSVSSVVFDDSLTNLDEVDITDTGMKETDVTLPGDFDGQLKGAYVEPKVSVTLDDLPEKIYGDEPFSLKDLDADKLDDITGISISYSVKSSEPGNIVSVDENGRLTINGAGKAVITATVSGYDDNRYEFVNTERTLTIGKRDAAISVLSDKIEDDASEVPTPKFEFVTTENTGVLEVDRQEIESLITLQWDTESVTEGVFGLKSTQLPEHADYNLSLQQPEGGASLTIVRAVNRKIMSVSQSESNGSMSVTVSKECRLKIGDKIYELKAGVNSFELSDLPTQFDVFTDYPEYVTAVDLSKTSVSSVVFDDSLSNLDEVDITDTGMKETDVTLPGDFDGELKGAYVEPKVTVTLDDLPEKVYGDEPFSLKDLDADKLDDITGISISYSVKSSEPENIVSVDENGRLTINRAGKAVITTTVSGYDDNRYEFANTERKLTIGKRDAAISVLSDKIEDDATEVPTPKFEFVTTENSGVLDADKEAVADIITLQWDTESVTEGVFGLKSTQLPEHADYNLSLQQPEGGASLTIVRAVNRKIITLYTNNDKGDIVLDVTKSCRIKIKNKIYNLNTGSNTISLSGYDSPIVIYTDYPEYITVLDLSNTTSTSVELEDNLTGLEEIDITDTGMSADDVKLPSGSKAIIKGAKVDEYHKVVIAEYNPLHGDVDFVVDKEYLNEEGKVHHGAKVTFIVTPTEGYIVDRCELNDSVVSLDHGLYIHESLTQDIVFKVIFTETSGIGSIMVNGSGISINGLTITIEKTIGSNITVRDLTGRTIATSSSTTITLNSHGVYIVECGQQLWKIKL